MRTELKPPPKTRARTLFVVDAEEVEAVPMLSKPVGLLIARVARKARTTQGGSSVVSSSIVPSVGCQAFLAAAVSTLHDSDGTLSVEMPPPTVVIQNADQTYTASCGFCAAAYTKIGHSTLEKARAASSSHMRRHTVNGIDPCVLFREHKMQKSIVDFSHFLWYIQYAYAMQFENRCQRALYVPRYVLTDENVVRLRNVKDSKGAKKAAAAKKKTARTSAATLDAATQATDDEEEDDNDDDNDEAVVSSATRKENTSDREAASTQVTTATEGRKDSEDLAQRTSATAAIPTAAETVEPLQQTRSRSNHFAKRARRC